jgi:hypothetical protein
VIVLALAVAPPAVLVAFGLALREAAEVPGRLRRLPATAQEHVETLAAAAREARESGPDWRRARALWRLRALVSSTRELVGVHAPIVALLSAPFLVATAVSAVAAVAEVGIALVVLIVLGVA